MKELTIFATSDNWDAICAAWESLPYEVTISKLRGTKEFENKFHCRVMEDWVGVVFESKEKYVQFIMEWS